MFNMFVYLFFVYLQLVNQYHLQNEFIFVSERAVNQELNPVGFKPVFFQFL